MPFASWQMFELAEPADNAIQPAEIFALHRQHATHQREVFAMAIEQYGYDPAAARTRAAAAIAAACERQGVPVDQETVLHHLRAAAKLRSNPPAAQHIHMRPHDVSALKRRCVTL